MHDLSGRLGRFHILGHWADSPQGPIYAAREARITGSTTKLYAVTVLPPVSETPHLMRTLHLPTGFAPTAIARPHDVFEHDGQLCVVTDFVRGETLTQVLRAEGKGLPGLLAVSIAATLARALHEAHAFEGGEGRLMHGDLCPSNVMITYDGKLVLTHFGLALAQSRLGRHQGHAGYMAPERATKTGVVTPASDVFSLGLVLYEMFLGAPAYKGSSERELLAQAVRGEVPELPPKMRGAGAIQGVLGDVLRADPRKRYGADELAAALAELRSTRAATFDLAGELTRLLERHFQHRAHALRKLEARWLGTQGSDVGRVPWPRVGSAPYHYPRGALGHGQEGVLKRSPSNVRGASQPGIARPPQPRPPSSAKLPEARHTPAATELPPLLAALPPALPPLELTASPLAVDLSRTDDLVRQESRDLPAPPPPLSFVKGVLLCWVVVMILSASTLFWPTEWLGAVLDMATRALGLATSK